MRTQTRYGKFKDKSLIKSVNYLVACNDRLMTINVTDNHNPDEMVANISVQGKVVFTAMKVPKISLFTFKGYSNIIFFRNRKISYQLLDHLGVGWGLKEDRSYNFSISLKDN